MSNLPLENTEPKAAVSKPLTFEERIAYRIADIVVERVVEGLSSKFGGLSKLTLHELPGCFRDGLVRLMHAFRVQVFVLPDHLDLLGIFQKKAG